MKVNYKLIDPHGGVNLANRKHALDCAKISAQNLLMNFLLKDKTMTFQMFHLWTLKGYESLLSKMCQEKERLLPNP